MIRRLIAVGGLALLAVALVGFGYERLMRAGDGERYPPPGRLVDVGGHQLHLVCAGSGLPTVVLEAGLGESALGWAALQRELRGSTRVCAYDRAGLAWSEPGPLPRTAAREAAELRALLGAGRERGPYVLVAHSFGGFVARLFVDSYPDEVVGLVLLDPTDESAVLVAGPPMPAILISRLQALLGEFGLLRLIGRGLVAGAVGGNPPPEVLEAIPILYGPRSQAATVAELEASLESASQVLPTLRPAAWGDRPAVIISAADASEANLAHHDSLAGLSSRGSHVVSPVGGHYIHYDALDFVLDQIR